MMNPIKIEKNKDDLVRKFDYVIKIENRLNFISHKPFFFALITTTIFEVFLLGFTSADAYSKLKSITLVLYSLFLISSIVYGFTYLYKKNRLKNSINEAIESSIRENYIVHLTFDDEKLNFTSDNYNLEQKWSHFKGLLETENTIFLFPEGDLYNFHSFSEIEIGKENLIQLIQLAKQKVAALQF